MSRWKAMIEESVRRREQRALGSGRGGGAGRYGPRPVLPPPVVGGLGVSPSMVGGAVDSAALDLLGAGASSRRNKPYKDIDVPKVRGGVVGGGGVEGLGGLCRVGWLA
jgi:hypothetical protein